MQPQRVADFNFTPAVRLSKAERQAFYRLKNTKGIGHELEPRRMFHFRLTPCSCLQGMGGYFVFQGWPQRFEQGVAQEDNGSQTADHSIWVYMRNPFVKDGVIMVDVLWHDITVCKRKVQKGIMFFSSRPSSWRPQTCGRRNPSVSF
jgi:hypothetical protein